MIQTMVTANGTVISDTVEYDLNSEINERNTYTRNIGYMKK